MNMALEMNELNEIIRKVTEEVCNRYGVCNAPAAPAAGGAMDPASLGKYIDHTLLKPEASVEDIKKVCDEAKKYHFASVCVNPSYIRYVAEQLSGSDVTPCCVIGFPFGTQTPEAKRFPSSPETGIWSSGTLRAWWRPPAAGPQ